MLCECAALLVDLIYLFKDLDGLSLLLEEILILYRKPLTPKLFILLLLLIHLRLLEKLLSAVLVSAVGPIEPRLNLMAEHVRLQSFSNVIVIDSFEVFGKLFHSFAKEDYILIPFLIDQSL